MGNKETFRWPNLQLDIQKVYEHKTNSALNHMQPLKYIFIGPVCVWVGASVLLGGSKQGCVTN